MWGRKNVRSRRSRATGLRCGLLFVLPTRLLTEEPSYWATLWFVVCFAHTATHGGAELLGYVVVCCLFCPHGYSRRSRATGLRCCLLFVLPTRLLTEEPSYWATLLFVVCFAHTATHGGAELLGYVVVCCLFCPHGYSRWSRATGLRCCLLFVLPTRLLTVEPSHWATLWFVLCFAHTATQLVKQNTLVCGILSIAAYHKTDVKH